MIKLLNVDIRYIMIPGETVNRSLFFVSIINLFLHEGYFSN